MFQRFRKLSRALPFGPKQPHVLDGDDRLAGEVLYKFNLLVSKWPNVWTVDADNAYKLVLLEQRHI